ncbi:MAG: SDR family NAD(P)-dependent oxidoreductase [Myxococcota bacterium]|jgi:NAD(P)-dependent dehydrogenase (short-subunit alcohol dehydrogenase family)|nr:short-chain dehydrogenase [Deltaproteobacteria bacterium]MCP4241691.1 SDR family NAD(P)-dependent oxidoreductase [bacterium]MDP6075188.1 SDR family NAD(P)-dependent oxidoreductase [Myxococcota bacterium]MDP6243833.1 SDR family NAD(P)-dependent oxidoreductase [Myxococcota bacterium]MDP7075893.1 SDR family NAD(P)-dependent oxidoreductase [Myxococcota bacterium]
MELRDKVVVVTGAASGIGKALAGRFCAEGAKRIVAVDLDDAGARATAGAVGGVAMAADVSRESDVARVIEKTEDDVGQIDLFCSNAGIAAGSELDSDDAEWQRSWEVNVMAHVYAARHLVPRMLARGGGYFLNTSSAAGLLNQIGGAAYGVTKHAAVGFGEWLALSYAHRGIRVSLLCPQAVRTAMTTGDAAEGGVGVAAASGDGMMEPEDVAEIVVEGLREERFVILTHPEVLEYMRRKTGDYDRWIRGMNRLHQRILALVSA